MASGKLNLGTISLDCPVCGKPFVIGITGQLVRRPGKPGQGVARVKVKHPLRVPASHRDCLAKVVD